MQHHAEGAWPRVARDDQLEEILAALEERPPRLQLVEGEAGAGKSVLALQAATTLPGGRSVTVTGLAERATTPLGAFAEVLGALDAEPGATVSTVVATIAHSLHGALVVDDAPRLDRPSAEVVRRLVAGFGIPVLATAREGEQLPGPLLRLEQDGLVRRHRLGGLSADEVSRLLEARFRVPARGDDVHRLVLQTEGNPLHLRILVESAIEAGEVLHRGDAVQFMTAADGSQELVAVVASRLAALSDEARRVLSVVAITQPVPRSSLVASRGREAALAELASHSMIVSDPEGDRVRVAHPLLAESLPEAGDVGKESVRILRSSGDPARRFGAVEVERRTGAPLDAQELVWAASYASARGDQRTAAGLAEIALGLPAPRPVAFAAHLAAANHRSLSYDLDEADRLFALADALARDPSERAALASQRGEHLAFRRGEPAAAVAQAERLRADLTDREAVALDAQMWRWRVLATQRDGDEDARELELRSAVAGVVAASMRGEPDAALAAAAALTSPIPVPASLVEHVAIAVGLQRAVELRASGNASEAASYLEAARADAGDEVGFFTVMLAAQRAQEGQLGEAESLADLAVEQFRRWDGGELLPFSLALRATLHAQRGEVVEARALLAELDGLIVSGAAVLQRAQCHAYLHVAAGDLGAAATTTLDVVADAIASGYRFLGTLTLSEALRFGEVERTASLAEQLCAGMAESVEPCLAVRDLAVALRERRPDRVTPIADRVARAGLTLAAIDGLALALALPAEESVRRELHACVARLSAGVDAPLIQHRELPALTARELEVARAAAQRLRAREIAERLGISVRTVENQLYSVYRKLGVDSRDALGDALDELGLGLGDEPGVRI